MSLQQTRLTTVLVPIAVAITFLGVTAAVAGLASSAERLEHAQNAGAIADARAEGFRDAIENEMASVEALSAFVHTTIDERDHMNEEFPVFAAALYDETSATLSLQLVEGTVITHVFPLARNRQALGLDLTALPGRRELVEHSIEHGEIIVEGPFELVQGGTGLAIRKPIYWRDGTFWGFGAVVVDWDAIPAVGSFGSDAGVRMGLRAVRDDRIVAGTSDAFGDGAVIRTISSPMTDQTWELAVIYSPDDTGSVGLTVWVLGGLLAGLVGLYLRMVLRRPEILRREREATLRDLADAEARYQAIFEHAAVGMAVSDAEGRILRRNQAFDRIFASVGGDRPVNARHVVHPSQVESYLRRIGPRTDVGESHEFDFRSWSTEEQWVHIQVTRIPDVAGERRYLGIVQDITERRRIKAALEESEQRFRELFEKTPVAVQREDHSAIERMVSELRASGVDDIPRHLEQHPGLLEEMVSSITILDANPKAEALMGYLGFDASGRRMGERLDDASAKGFLESIGGIARGQSSQSYPSSVPAPDGSLVHLDLVWYAPIKDGRPDYSSVFVVFNDNTELRNAQIKLEAMLESKNRFVASVAHELRTPLTAVVGFAHELKDGDAHFTGSEREEFRDLISFHADEMSHMIEDLLVWSRTDIGEVKINMEPVDVARTAVRTVESIPGRHIDRLGPAEGVSALCDPVRLRQIIRNLVTNAIRHGGDAIAYDVTDEDGLVKVAVMDDGPPIAPHHSERMFEPYERLADNVTAPGSIGLGLAVSRTLARLQGGDLVLDRRGRWNVFEFTLHAEHMSESESREWGAVPVEFAPPRHG